MIQVGINENVFISDISIDEKANLHITFKEAGKAMSLFERLNSESIVEDTSGLEIRLFGIQVATDPTMTQEKKADRAGDDITVLRSRLEHIMSGYLTKDEYRMSTIFAEGTGMDNDNYFKKLTEQPVLDKITSNLFNFFKSAMTPYVGKKELPFRLLLTRQSKDKHFATLRRKYIEDNPFWESMDVPEEASKLKFTEYEIKEGLNDPTPTSRSTADAKSSSATDATKSLTEREIDDHFGTAE